MSDLKPSLVLIPQLNSVIAILKDIGVDLRDNALTCTKICLQK